jgi:hypothetical protein
LREVFTSTCKPDKDRILREVRRNPNELDNNPKRLVGSRISFILGYYPPREDVGQK